MKIARMLIPAALLVAAMPALAQDPSLDPNYRTIELDSGFANDPRIIPLQAGGTIAASETSSECRGFITDAPDVRLVTTRARCR